MKISEVIRIPDREFDDRKTRDGIARASQSKQSSFSVVGDIVITMGLYSSKTMDFLFSKNRVPCGFALLQHGNVADMDGWYVTEIGLLPNARGSGVGYGFYLDLLEKNYRLFSGMQQTRFSEATWKRLMAHPSIDVRMAVDDQIMPVDQIDPWGHPGAILIAESI